MQHFVDLWNGLVTVAEIAACAALGLFIYWHGIGFAMDMAKRFRRH